MSQLDQYWREALPAPEMVRRSFGEETYREGMRLFQACRVRNVVYTTDELKARVEHGRTFKPVWRPSPSGGLRLHCTCRRKVYCSHQIALYLSVYANLHNDVSPKPEQTEEVPESFLLEDTGYWDRSIPQKPLQAKSRQMLLQSLFAVPEESDQNDYPYQLSPQICVTPSELKLLLFVDSPRLKHELRAPYQILQIRLRGRCRPCPAADV